MLTFNIFATDEVCPHLLKLPLHTCRGKADCATSNFGLSACNSVPDSWQQCLPTKVWNTAATEGYCNCYCYFWVPVPTTGYCNHYCYHWIILYLLLMMITVSVTHLLMEILSRQPWPPSQCWVWILVMFMSHPLQGLSAAYAWNITTTTNWNSINIVHLQCYNINILPPKWINPKQSNKQNINQQMKPLKQKQPEG